MSVNVPIEAGSHYYRILQDGTVEAAYDLGLREARKENLYPSPTTVLKVLANSYLDAWIKGQIITACINDPFGIGQDVEFYASRIIAASNKRRDDSRDFGNRLHAALDKFGSETIDDTALRPWLDQFVPWYEVHVSERIGSEIMLADSDIGIAGKTDLVYLDKEHGLCIADYKSTRVSASGIKFYKSWARQLAFYAKAYQKREKLAGPPRIKSVVMDSQKPSPPVEKLWTVDEQQSAYDEFVATAFIWFSERGFWPVGKWSLAQVGAGVEAIPML